MALLNETNAQYYSGQQAFVVALTGSNQEFNCTFNTTLVDSPIPNYIVERNGTALNINQYKVTNNLVTVFISLAANDDILVKLTQTAINDNYGSYEYIKLSDVINNFIVGYVGAGKLIPACKRTDIMFHAKRGLQEFSYDTLKSIKSQELTIPPSLSVAIPQDYVNYVKCSWIDDVGAKHIIYPTRVTSNPEELPIQDDNGIPTQDDNGNNIESDNSITEDRWAAMSSTTNNQPDDYRLPRKEFLLGQRYGLQPEEAQVNGTFTINERLGTFSFSNELVGKLIILEYISDGLAYDGDMKIPKMAEQAIYMHIAHGILSGRANVPEYIVNRFKRERFSALRNAKIRLSNIKTEEIAQVLRNKAKWIKH
tara:strand:- start:26 stop:1126 length:1101 start_codon:yes stop_codon:yes gene_type:complete